MLPKEIQIGAFDVFYVEPRDEGKTFVGLGSITQFKYSSKNWIDVLDELGLCDKNNIL